MNSARPISVEKDGQLIIVRCETQQLTDSLYEILKALLERTAMPQAKVKGA